MAMCKDILRVMWRVLTLSGILLFISCENGVEEASSSYVSFEIANSQDWNEVTKGQELNNVTLRSSGFGVLAYYTEDDDWSQAAFATPNFMNNTRVTSSNSGKSWQYAPLKYWPHNQKDKVTFFAYAPYNGNLAGSDVSGSKVDFEIAQDVDNQKDISWSNSSTMNLNKNVNAVNFTFRHALARIGFAVKASADAVSPLREEITMTIKKVTIGYGAGATGGFYTSGTLDLNNTTNTPAWSSISGSTSFSLDPANFVGNGSSGFALTSENSSETQRLNRDDAYIMVLPQDFSSNGFRLFVEYEVSLLSKNQSVDYHTYTNRGYADVKLNLEANKTYIIYINTDLKSISIDDISITQWDEDGGSVIIPGIVPEI